ncbi:integrin alpha-5-like [Rissa tridactyla]|uniref:integrin alpha-5-like n=1 Tax=Rissa tridactyla TaxID=75485 RepID=UPI0023BA7FE1|nr:integrin alpha-5-like [Rissa tridactyla]
MGTEMRGPRTHDFGGNNTETPDPVEFKSLQWFGATVRGAQRPPSWPAPRCTAGAPPRRRGGGREPVGTCFLSIGNFSKFVGIRAVPLRPELRGPGRATARGASAPSSPRRDGCCWGGPGSYFWQGQVMSATQEQIAASSYPEYFIQEVAGQLQTRQAAPTPRRQLHGLLGGSRRVQRGTRRKTSWLVSPRATSPTATSPSSMAPT